MLRRLPPLLLVLLVALPVAAAKDEAAPPAQVRLLSLDGAAVLASPGTPSDGRDFLPGGAVPSTLRWPLPATGHLLVLALPNQDPAARALADAFGFDVDPETLHGGYVLHAWEDAGRTLAFVFADDPAALYAARFEFELTAPREMLDPNMRSLDFRKPDAQAGMRIASGTRHVRPAFRRRALAHPRSGKNGGAASRAALLAARLTGAHANEVWLDEADAHRQEGLLRRLAAQGLQVVHVLRWSAEPGTARSVATWAATLDKTRRHRHVAIVFETPLRTVRQMGTYYRAYERAVVRKVAAVLRPHLETLYVVPRCHSDRLARAHGAPPALGDVPEAIVAWSGPREHPVRISRADAEQRVEEAGGPVFLLDTWAGPFSAPAHVPLRPRGRDADLGEVLHGVVVTEGPGSDDLLEMAWAPEASRPRADAPLAGLASAPQGAQDATGLLAEARAELEARATEMRGFHPWLRPLAQELAGISGPVTGIRCDQDSDGTWQSAGILADAHGARLQARSDGSALHVRIALAPAQTSAPYWVQVRLAAPGRAAGWRVTCTPEEATLERVSTDGSGGAAVGHVDVLRTETPDTGGTRIELVFDRFALGGDAHALRVFRLGVSLGPRLLWPTALSSGPDGTLLVVQ